MAILLRRLNVVKQAETEYEAARLEAKGFERISSPEDEAEENLEEMSLTQLRKLAKAKGISGASKMTADELLPLLQGTEKPEGGEENGDNSGGDPSRNEAQA